MTLSWTAAVHAVSLPCGVLARQHQRLFCSRARIPWAGDYDVNASATLRDAARDRRSGGEPARKWRVCLSFPFLVFPVCSVSSFRPPRRVSASRDRYSSAILYTLARTHARTHAWRRQARMHARRSHAVERSSARRIDEGGWERRKRARGGGENDTTEVSSP